MPPKMRHDYDIESSSGALKRIRIIADENRSQSLPYWSNGPQIVVHFIFYSYNGSLEPKECPRKKLFWARGQNPIV